MHPEVFQGSSAYPVQRGASPVVTIGNFDGVHLGHRVLLGRATELARAAGRPALAYTFDPAPRDVLRPGNPIPRIQTLEDKLARLGEVGIDQVVVEPFSREFGAHSAQWFAEEVLTRRLGARHVVVGWDFRFGRGRAGDAQALQAWLDVPVEQVEAYAPDGEVVSSSRIREAVGRGDVEAAARLLGRPHEVTGEVVRGDARGRSLGFPTANLQPRTALVPVTGVYAAVVDRGQGKRFFGVVNIGQRPTFEGAGPTLEVHLLDFDGDLYGTELRVGFVARLRDERRFESVDALVEQIGRDVLGAREVLGAKP